MDGSDGSDRASELDSDETLLLWRRLLLSKAKLKGVTEMAALMAGFSVIATVELTIEKGTNELLLVSFSVATALLVSTTMLSIMIATCVLPHLEAVAKMESIQLLKQSPHDSVSFYIDLAWFLANTVSIFLFIVDVVLLCWIKFTTTPAIWITSIMIPVLILLFIFSIIFYRQTVLYQISVADERLDELRAMTVRLKLNEQDQYDEDEDNISHNSRDVGINMPLQPPLPHGVNGRGFSGSGTHSSSSLHSNEYALRNIP